MEPPAPPLAIRPVRDADVEALVALWRACGLTRPWNDPWHDIALARAAPSGDILVGHDRSARLVASAMVGWDGHRGALYYLAVAPDDRGRGHGGRMLHAAEAAVLAMGGEKMNLLVRSENAGVIRFYERHGYVLAEVSSLGRWLIENPNAPTAHGQRPTSKA